MAGTPMIFGMTETLWAESLKRWSKRLYWFVGIIVLLYFCYNLFTRNQQIAAVLVFLSGFIALYFYYVKWFVVPERIPNWPPYTTPCPDFLTLVEPGDDSKPGKCMDFVGVSKNGMLKPVTSNNFGSYKENGEYYYAVGKKYTDPVTKKVKEYSLDEICRGVKEKGLTWISLCPDE